MLVFCKCLVHQPAAEKMGMVCAQPKGDGDDYLKRVNIRIQTVFKLDVAACLVVVQHVRFEDGFDGGVHCRDTTCKFFDLVQSRGKVLHVLIELLFGYL